MRAWDGSSSQIKRRHIKFPEALDHRQASFVSNGGAADALLEGVLVIYLAQLRKPDLREMELAELLTNTASLIISRYEESAVRRRAEEPRHES